MLCERRMIEIARWAGSNNCCLDLVIVRWAGSYNCCLDL